MIKTVLVCTIGEVNENDVRHSIREDDYEGLAVYRVQLHLNHALRGCI